MMSLAADAPSVTDWLAAWGQIAGAAATVLAVVVALSIASRDRRRAERDRAEEARHRAARVASTLYGSVVTITNHGTDPIWQPEVVSCTVSELPEVIWRSRVRGAAREVLASGDDVEVRGDWRNAQDESVNARDFPEEFEYVAVVEFTDVEGRRWRRVAEAIPVALPDGEGRLRRLQLGRLGIDWRTRTH